MQNFTFGRKGTNWFLFAFVLLIGTLPSFGQECPTVDEPTQSFCDALSTVSDLAPAGATWYADETSDEPLPSNELLIDGEDYYADSDDCTTPRSDRRVVVTLTEPVNAPLVQDDFFTPCSGGGPYTIADLKEAIDASAAPSGYSLEIFPTRYGKDDAPLADSTPLTTGNYFAGFYDGSDCQSRRRPVRFEPVEAPAPAAASPQVVCEGTTVSELEAEGTNLWYRTSTSEPALPDDFIVQNGETYYVSQVVPSDGPPCESGRTAVTVTVEDFDAGENSLGNEICRADLDARIADPNESVDAILLSFLGERDQLEGTSVEFDPTIAELGEEYGTNPIQTFTITATFTTENGCEDDVVIELTVNESFDAGDDNTEGNEVCRSEFSTEATSEEVENYLISLLSVDFDEDNGSFSNIDAIVAALNNSDGSGNFSSTYTVGEGTECADSAELSFTVLADASTTLVPVADLCNSDIPALVNEIPEDVEALFLENFGENIPEGEFAEGDIQRVINEYNAQNIGTFTVTYNITDENFCATSIELSRTVAEDFNAGSDNTSGNEVCFSNDVTEQEVEDYLISLLSDNADQGGIFSPTASEIANDIPGETTFNVTYTVGEGTECEDSANLQFTVLEDASVNLVEVADLCNDDIPALVNEIPEDVEALFLENFGENIPEGEFAEGDIQRVINEYNAQNIGTFTVTYNFTGENFCSGSIELSRTVIEGEEANAGAFDNIEDVCTNDEPIDLTTLSNSNSEATEGGTFTGEGVTNNVFDPSTVEPGTYDITYTVDESVSCIEGSDETTFTIEVIQGPNAGQDISGSICISRVEEIVADNFPNREDIIQALFEEFNFTGERGGNIESNLGNDFNTIALALAAYYGDDERDDSLLIEGTYTVGDPQDECGTDVSNFSITINDTQDANAGSDVTYTVCEGDAMFDLSVILSDDAMTEGTFSLNGEVLTDNMFDPSIGINEDGYIVTYTVTDSSNCVTEGTSDTAEYRIIVSEGRDLGEEITANLCVSDLQDTYSEQVIRNYFAGLIPNYSPAGTFDRSIAEITEQYNSAESKIGTYQTTYTLGTGACEDSVTITVNVEGEVNADAGDDFTTTLCTNEEAINLFNELSANANPDGYFEYNGEEFDGNFDPAVFSASNEPYVFTYFVGPSTACVEGTDTAEFSITVYEAPNAGQDISESLCITEAEEMITNPQAAIDWFNNLIDVDGVDQDGTFDPALEILAAQIVAYISNPEEASETFSTTYTVENDNCEDSATITLTINDEVEAEAGEDVAVTFCASQGEIDLRDYLSEGANPNGYFEGDDFDGIINTNNLDQTEYTYTYIVDESVDCVTGEDSVEFTVTIIEDLFVGTDKFASVCNANIENGQFPNSTSVRDFYLNLLDEGVSRNGTFSPSIQDLVDWYNNESELGDFTTTYTVTQGECSASVQLTVTVYDEVPAELEPIDDVTLCSIDEDQDLYSFLSTNAIMDGNFIWNDEVIEGGILSPSMLGAGEYEITYSITDETPCVSGEASESFTVTVLETVTAGMDMDAALCANQGEVNLYNYLDAQASDSGEFTYEGEVLADGIFDASAMGEGTFEVTYTVEPINECGVESSTLTITVNEVPDAPEADATFFACESDMATAAWLEAEGTDLIWYADADLTMMVSEEDMLESGSYYVTQTLNGCESEAAEVVVTINVVPAPTASTTSFEFCDRDAATLADLTDAISFEGTLIWYDSADGDNSLGTSTRLQNGTYYASQDDGECESLDRLAITVSVENCPIIYPEGISPNGDGINDTFIVENLENEYPNYSIEIFNRWGNTIYKGNASTPAWDGTSNQSGALGDDVLPIGVYFYVIDYGDGSTAPRQGKVYLSR
ncbi:gliding motility-associated C-terminal domain-containing protein [Salegentibacter sp. HM20]